MVVGSESYLDSIGAICSYPRGCNRPESDFKVMGWTEAALGLGFMICGSFVIWCLCYYSGKNEHGYYPGRGYTPTYQPKNPIPPSGDKETVD